MKTNNLIKYQGKQEMLKRFMSIKANISYIQILILIISTFAFCYLIYSATELVNAQEIGDYVCCEETNNGNVCQFVPSNECKQGVLSAPTECKDASFCKEGCCISSQTGFCNEASVEKDCDNGIWFEDASCNVAQCSRGCCVLGNNALFTTERNCEIESGFLGLDTDFRSEINSEIECIFLAERDDEGACVLGESCVFTTKGECKNRAGDFYKNTFCSDTSLETNCVAQDHKACVEGQESVYWFDSCGNKEDVAEECSLFGGAYCGLGIGGDYTCKSVNCDNTMNGNNYKNGESWCMYDGTIGDGKDVAGSRHVRHICFMGEERIEPCQDYRNQICVGSETDLGSGKTFSEAACRINNWRSCIDYNSEENQENVAEKCNENPDCKIQGVHIDKFSFDICVPNYPPGFDLINEAGARNAELVCGMGSQKCTVIYVKKLSGWKCKVNCGCEDTGFTQQMNDLCINLGDCGGYVNIAGEYTDDGYSSGAGKISGNQYKKYAEYKPNQEPAEPGDLSFLSLTSPSEPSYDEDSGLFGLSKEMKNSLGVYGVGYAIKWISGKTILGSVMGSPSTIAYGNAIMGIGSAMIAASILSMAFDLDYLTALAIIGGGITAIVAFTSVTWTHVIKFAKDPITIIVLLVIIAALKIFGIGKTKKKVINFQCLPWQPPTGGSDCGKCNINNPLGVPCSDYRCQSLGQTCELINKGTENQLCIDNSPTDVSSPRISPLFGTMTEGYEYYDIQNNGFKLVDSNDKACIPEFTQIEYGIETNKPAQCKVSNDPLLTYEQMPDYFGGSNLYLINHTNIMFMPSPEAFRNQYNLTDAQIAALGEVDFYIKCKSVNGQVNTAAYTIKTCVKPGPDLTAPYVTKTDPANEAYIAYNQTEQDLQIWVNEPANCKYSITNQNYDLMENSFECQQDLEDYELYGWACSTTLNVNVDDTFYIRCKDISDNQNPMQQSYVYELQKSASNLIIDETRPVDGAEIFSGVEPLTVNLQVKTSGGAEQGKAECYYRFSSDSSYIKLFDTYSDYHEQVFSSIIRGTYNIDLMCKDVAGNSAEKSISFKVEIDTAGPRIARIYYDAELKIFTNEEAECRYAFSKSTTWENASLMSTSDDFEHVADWQLRTYYIQCEDKYENKGGKTRIKTYNLI